MVHFCITLIYGLPLLGVVYLMRQFEAGAGFTFFYGNTMAIMVGVMALFVERRHPFPTEPMLPPPFAYEVSQLIPQDFLVCCVLLVSTQAYSPASLPFPPFEETCYVICSSRSILWCLTRFKLG
jgi:hypothetical protein